MTIGNKNAVGFTSILLLFLVVGTVVFRNTQRLIADSAWVTHTHAVLETVAELRVSLRTADDYFHRYVITGDQADLGAYRAAQSRIDTVLLEFQAATTDSASQQQRARSAKRQMAAYFAALDYLVRERGTDSGRASAAAVRAGVTATKLEEARALLLAMRDEEERLLGERAKVSAETAAQSLAVMVWGGVLTLAFLVGAAWVMTRMVTVPVKQLLLGAEQFGSGNLAHRIALRVSDELGSLAQAFNRMAQTLGATTVSADTDQRARSRIEGLLQTITETASSLVSATAEILAATSEQTNGAQHQVAAVAMTVSTISAVVQTAEQAAERAHSVAGIAQRSLAHSKNGKQVIEESIAVMARVQERVETSASSILSLSEHASAVDEIISGVSELAEQTNMLALSATIEASRAGEHGRSFAVVAAEVKVLAERSKTATAQVKKLLSEIQKATNVAVMNTEECSKSVQLASSVIGQAGDSFRGLAEIIDQAARDASQIAASAGQQASGTAQIQASMKSIDQVTMQNLSATRQMQQAAKDLSLLGHTLRERLEA